MLIFFSSIHLNLKYVTVLMSIDQKIWVHFDVHFIILQAVTSSSLFPFLAIILLSCVKLRIIFIVKPNFVTLQHSVNTSMDSVLGNQGHDLDTYQPDHFSSKFYYCIDILLQGLWLLSVVRRKKMANSLLRKSWRLGCHHRNPCLLTSTQVSIVSI